MEDTNIDSNLDPVLLATQNSEDVICIEISITDVIIRAYCEIVLDDPQAVFLIQQGQQILEQAKNSATTNLLQ